MGFAKPPPTKSIYTICDAFKEDEDFQTVALYNDHWITYPVPDRHLCIHEHLQPHSLFPTHVHIAQIPLQHHTVTHWTSVTSLTLKM